MPQEHGIDRAVLVGLHADCFSKEETATNATLDELEALLETAGGQCTAKVLQNRRTPDSRTFIGAGKAAEIRQLAENTEANMAIFDNTLSPSQIRVLEEILGVTVLDRSALILDIFAQRAKTPPRADSRWSWHSISISCPACPGWEPACPGGRRHRTRGPGETQLETDRRHHRSRIAKLEEELTQVRQVRAVQRRQRIKNSVPVVALVGYTNAGKSTLLNRLTGAGIPANNRLFDTLDTTSRQWTVSETLSVILSDTGRLYRQAAPHLVDAFAPP